MSYNDLSPLKIKFGTVLRECMREAKLRQLDLAVTLNITPSAISQIISGRMVPSLLQLDQMAQKMHLERARQLELRDLLSKIRLGDPGMGSPFNAFLRSARIKRGLSIPQLSNLTGISVGELNTLENGVNAMPTITEAARLAAVLDCELKDLCHGAMSWSWGMGDAGSGAAAAVAPGAGTEFRENAPYQTEAKDASGASSVLLPQVDSSKLYLFDPAYESLQAFAWRYTEDARTLEVALNDAVIVHCQCGVWNLPAAADILLVLAPGCEAETGCLVLWRNRPADNQQLEYALGILQANGEILSWPGYGTVIPAAECSFCCKVERMKLCQACGTAGSEED